MIRVGEVKVFSGGAVRASLELGGARLAELGLQRRDDQVLFAFL